MKKNRSLKCKGKLRKEKMACCSILSFIMNKMSDSLFVNQLRGGTGRFVIYITLLVFCAQPSFAQNVQVAAHLDSNSILIGEQVHLHLSAFYNLHNGLLKIQWPAIGDSLTGKVHVVSRSKVDTIVGDSTHTEQQLQKEDILITSFDSGYYAIPPFRFIVNGDTEHPLVTEPIMLTVHTVAVDTNKGIRDIKGPLSAPWSILEILPWLGFGAAVLAAIALLVYFIRRYMKNRKVEPVIIKAPPIEPHIKALKTLEELPGRKLWQEGKIKEYHSVISDTLRIYIQERFGIGAPEMITSEIMQALRRSEIANTPNYLYLQQILLLADLVKFAKEKPLPAEHEKSLTDAINFVKGTMVINESVQPSANSEHPNLAKEHIQQTKSDGNGVL